MTSTSQTGSDPAVLAVFDTGPLIYLDILGYTSLLEKLYQVVIPPAVVAELRQKPGRPGGGVPGLTWVKQQRPKRKTLRRVHRELTADPGEEEVIALALDLASWVVIDERRGRAYASNVGLRLTGTLGILLDIHKSGLAGRTISTELILLDANGMHISSQLKQLVLDQVTTK